MSWQITYEGLEFLRHLKIPHIDILFLLLIQSLWKVRDAASLFLTQTQLLFPSLLVCDCHFQTMLEE